RQKAVPRSRPSPEAFVAFEYLVSFQEFGLGPEAKRPVGLSLIGGIHRVLLEKVGVSRMEAIPPGGNPPSRSAAPGAPSACLPIPLQSLKRFSPGRSSRARQEARAGSRAGCETGPRARRRGGSGGRRQPRGRGRYRGHP